MLELRVVRGKPILQKLAEVCCFCNDFVAEWTLMHGNVVVARARRFVSDVIPG